ncbi:auxin-responsive protein SAUR68-like [Nicotiana tabacum]|uniref:Auxin-responsive protein SAUR68-like n=1 Tax=Nicotiana tabacum TaxID=4097 RepID=A0A1S4CYA1_TOBAC|nr:PREDICTED: auxin-responsive protein SAUR68-like [Nicotiana tabacum]
MDIFHHQVKALSIQPSKVSKFLVYFLASRLSRKRKMERKAMVSTKKLIKMARRWQKFAVKQRKRISLPRNGSDKYSCSTSSSSIVEKGHFVVYTDDQARFVIPLVYLENEVIRHLLSMSEEEFGLPSGGPITLPCDSAFMDYIMSLIKKGVTAGDLHKALLLSIPSCCCSTSSFHQESGNQQILAY